MHMYTHAHTAALSLPHLVEALIDLAGGAGAELQAQTTRGEHKPDRSAISNVARTRFGCRLGGEGACAPGHAALRAPPTPAAGAATHPPDEFVLVLEGALANLVRYALLRGARTQIQPPGPRTRSEAAPADARTPWPGAATPPRDL
jgi:hypothetical protein